MRRIRIPLLTALLGLLLPLLVAAAPVDSAARGADGPTVHPQLRLDVAEAAADARLDVVVTAWDARGLETLDELGVASRKLRTLPIALARPTATQIGQLAGDTRIRSLWPVESFELFLDEGTAMVGADRVAGDFGVQGEDVVVGVIDTGIDTTHPDLDGDKVLGNFQVVGDLDGPLLVESPFTDDHGHGTHVSSTIAGDDEAKDDANGDMSGVAPKAQLYGYAINAGTSVLSNLALVAFDDLIARRQAGENIVAASNSWGGGDGTYSPDDPLAVATKALVDNGIVPVFAAGNDGPGLMTASNQCTIPWTFCVAAITKGRTLAGFSSRGRTPTPTTEYEPTEDPEAEGSGTAILAGNHDVALGQALEIGVYRPNVSAPGVDIEAACSTAAGCPGGYQLMSGTSMATPHVSGVIALVQSARLAAGGELLPARQVTSLVENTANRMPGYELWEVGTGEVDALEAVQRVMAAGDGPVAIPTANYGATTAEGGEPETTTHSGQVLPNSWETGVGQYVEEFEVAPGTGRLDALLTWGRPTDNIYLNLYAPGLVPGEDPPTAQSAGLLDGTGPYMRMYRELEVHFPEAGTWTLEVHGRTNAPIEATVEITRSPVDRPNVTLNPSGNPRGTTDAGKLDAPTATGVTRDAIPGTGEQLPTAGTPTQFWLHSTAGHGDQAAEFFLVDPPAEPSFDTTEPSTPASKVSEVTPLANDAFAGNFLTAYWAGQVDGVIAGDVTLSAWMSSPTGAAFTSHMTATLFAVPADYEGEGDAENPVQVLATTATDAPVGATPAEVQMTFADVLTGDLTGKDVVLQLHGTYVDTGHVQLWHDSTTHPSSLVIPILEGDAGDLPGAAPTGVHATDGVGGGATLAWDEVDGADAYVVERASAPTGPFEAIAEVDGTEHTDTRAPVRTTSYYRVRSVVDGVASVASEVAYATPIDDSAFVEVKFGPYGPWEAASLTGSAWSYDGLGTGDIQVRASRWFTTSPLVAAAE